MITQEGCTESETIYARECMAISSKLVVVLH